MTPRIARNAFALLLLLWSAAVCAQAPSCWPSNVGGTGTRYYIKLIDSPAGHPEIDPVWALWWHCPDTTQASGWQTPHLMCAEQNLPTCLATPIVATVSGAAAAWAAAAPSAPASIGMGWAESMLFSQYVPPTLPSAPAPTDWTFCAAEGDTCTFSGTQRIRYGLNGAYAYGTFTGSVACNNSVFGDPLIGTGKQCDVAAPAPAPTWKVAPNGTRTTRPAFAVTNGVRALSSTSKATVGAPCDCGAIKLIEGRTTYCQVAPATVSACVSSLTP